MEENECVLTQTGVCMRMCVEMGEKLLLHIMCGFACTVHANISEQNLIMIPTAPCLNVIPRVNVACCSYFSNSIKNKLASKAFYSPLNMEGEPGGA